jgi:OmpA-OmpF porin, OOP family
MKKIVLLLFSLSPLVLLAQNGTTVQGNLPKDAQVDVTITHARTGAPLPSEIIVFRSQANGTEFQGLSNDQGKFSLRLPSAATYEVFILGFHDSTSYNTLKIPALGPNQYFKNAFNFKIEFEPPGSFVLDNCTFETGKADLKPEAFTVLDELVEYLKRKEDERIEVGGHTDNVGKPDANMILSQNRANTVRAYLLMKGIAPDRVTAKGYGMTQPITDNDTPEGRAMNRRTEVKVL